MKAEAVKAVKGEWCGCWVAEGVGVGVGVGAGVGVGVGVRSPRQR